MNFIGMRTRSGSSLKPEEAYHFLGSVKNLHSVVVGISKKEHIKETSGVINGYIKLEVNIATR